MSGEDRRTLSKLLMRAGRAWIDRIANRPRVILDLYPRADVVAFECSPESVPICAAANRRSQLTNLRLEPFAAPNAAGRSNSTP